MGKLDNLDPASLSSNPRATESAWRRYEKMILAAYNHRPKPFIIVASLYNLSPHTLCSRIREAIRGKLAFDYPSEVSAAELKAWYHHNTVSYTIDTVIIGPKSKLVNPPLEPPPTQNHSDLQFDSLNVEEFMAFAFLVNSGKLQGPVLIRRLDTSIDWQARLSGLSNIQILNRPDGSTVLI